MGLLHLGLLLHLRLLLKGLEVHWLLWVERHHLWLHHLLREHLLRHHVVELARLLERHHTSHEVRLNKAVLEGLGLGKVGWGGLLCHYEFEHLHLFLLKLLDGVHLQGVHSLVLESLAAAARP
jgi:hypothetical protein